jgi:hypothetical protein
LPQHASGEGSIVFDSFNDGPRPPVTSPSPYRSGFALAVATAVAAGITGAGVGGLAWMYGRIVGDDRTAATDIAMADGTATPSAAARPPLWADTLGVPAVPPVATAAPAAPAAPVSGRGAAGGAAGTATKRKAAAQGTRSEGTGAGSSGTGTGAAQLPAAEPQVVPSASPGLPDSPGVELPDGGGPTEPSAEPDPAGSGEPEPWPSADDSPEPADAPGMHRHHRRWFLFWP